MRDEAKKEGGIWDDRTFIGGKRYKNFWRERDSLMGCGMKNGKSHVTRRLRLEPGGIEINIQTGAG